MLCAVTAFARHNGCPDISVALDFPTLDYCTSPAFTSPAQPELAVQVLKPSPDLAVMDVGCINISPSIDVHAPADRASGAANFSLSTGHDCQSGPYRLQANLYVPCLISGIARLMPIKVQGRQAGNIRVSLAACSGFTLRASYNTSNLSTLAFALEVDCLVATDISGSIETGNSDVEIEKSNCQITKIVIRVPAICPLEPGLSMETPLATAHSRFSVVWHNNVTKYARLQPMTGFIFISSPDIFISQADYHYRVSGALDPCYGHKGPDGPTGKPMELIEIKDLSGYTGPTGAPGLRGIRGSNGIIPEPPDLEQYRGQQGTRGPTGEAASCHAGEGTLAVVCTCPHVMDFDLGTSVMTVYSAYIANSAIHVHYAYATRRIRWSCGDWVMSVSPLVDTMFLMSGRSDWIPSCVVVGVQ